MVRGVYKLSGRLLLDLDITCVMAAADAIREGAHAQI